MVVVSEILRLLKMLQILPIIIISSTIPLCENQPIILDQDYSQEAADCMDRNTIHNSQDTSNILYDLIIEELMVDQFRP